MGASFQCRYSFRLLCKFRTNSDFYLWGCGSSLAYQYYEYKTKVIQMMYNLRRNATNILEQLKSGIFISDNQLICT